MVSIAWSRVQVWKIRDQSGPAVDRPGSYTRVQQLTGLIGLSIGPAYVRPVSCWTAFVVILTHSLTAALDQLRVVASSTSNDPGPRSRQHQQLSSRTKWQGLPAGDTLHI